MKTVSTPDLLWRLVAQQVKAGNIELNELAPEFKPKSSATNWRKWHRFKARIEKELESNV